MVYTLCVECALCVLQGFQDNETKGPHHMCISELDNNNKNYQIYLLLIVIESTCQQEFVGLNVCEYIDS
jgi:hypothetical protein